MRKIKLRITEIIIVVKYIIAKLYSIFLHKEQLWLISERGFEARDNAYHFFLYVKQSHPEINIKYVIDKKSQDYERLKKYEGDIINYGSFKHYLLLCLSTHLISTHIMGYTPNMGFFYKLDKYLNLFKSQKKIFLQHGIIKDYLPVLFGNNVRLDLFCCGAKPEFDYVFQNFNHPIGVVQYTGLCRYDKLNDFNTNKQILVMPTWRTYINKENLYESAYYKYWKEFLEDKVLHQILAKTNYKLYFYPHYEMQKHLALFKQMNLSENIIVADFKFDVQSLLKESSLLVTDYSSVYFDFVYMKKPVIYYQFDEDEFRKYHYQKGYINESIFGVKVSNTKDLVDRLHISIQENCAPSSTYGSVYDDFFPIRDTNNCNRVYTAIKALDV